MKSEIYPNKQNVMKNSLLPFLSFLILPIPNLPAAIGMSTTSFTESGSVVSHISSTDLVNSGSPHLLSVSSSPFANIPQMNDGTINSSFIIEEDSHYPATIVFNFDTITNPLGYRIDGVTTITGLSQVEAQFTPFDLNFTELSPNFSPCPIVWWERPFSKS